MRIARQDAEKLRRIGRNSIDAKEATIVCAMGIVGKLNRSGMEACRRGQFEEAEAKLLMALEMVQTSGGGCTAIKVHNNLGIVYELQGRQEMALHHYSNALDLMVGGGAANHPMHGRLARSLARVAPGGSTVG